MPPFGKPASGENFNNADNNGRLLLVEPLGTKTGIVTSASAEPVDVIVANVVVLDGPEPGKVYKDTYLFGRVLFNTLKNPDERFVLGRLAKGQKQPGKHAPWVLNEFTPADAEVAEKYLSENPPREPTTTPAAAPAPAEPSAPSGDIPF